jgi:hypothetical protein
MKITIEEKTFELKFGFKCFINLGKALGLNTFNEVVQKFAQFENLKDDISFEQLDLIEELVVAAVQAHPKYYELDYNITDVSVIDGIMTQPDLLNNIMTAFVESFPKEDKTVGKRKAGTTRKQKKS